ncbi:hypothetical protein ACFVT1_00210 [Streptomyces sp. NPDC057963]|uniref:hypothetical protein n=1 Tax=Streptomyces sp. NPDC057963 TaxID=3346290 RepID=UPI0036E19840
MTEKEPSGSAQVSDVSVRADANSAGALVDLAVSSALSSSLTEPSSTGSSAAAAAALFGADATADAEATGVRARADPTTVASAREMA